MTLKPIIVAAIALTGISAGAYSQTPDTRVLVLPAPLKDGDGDGYIKLTTKAIAPFKRNETVKYCAGRDPYTYVAENAGCDVPTPEPTPTPTPTPEPTPDMLVLGGEWFSRTNEITVGFNKHGTLTSLASAPEGWSDPADPYSRKGFYYRPTKAELAGIAAISEIWGVAYTANGARARVTSGPLAGYGTVEGTFGADGTWTARQACLSVQQRPTLDGATLTVEFTVQNVCSHAISDVRILRSLDVDDGDELATTTVNKITALGTVQAGLLHRSKGRAFVLSSADATARAAIGPSVITANPDTASLYTQKVGYSVTAGDRPVVMTWRIGDLAPGASETVRFEMGVR